MLTCEASPTGLTRPAITPDLEFTARSTPCEIAQSRSLAGIICSSDSSVVFGTGIGQPVRCASTDSSVHSLIPGYSSSARCATRISRSVHGLPTQSAPQVMLRGWTMLAGVDVSAETPASRTEPSGIRASSGKSIPSANTAASPGRSVTRYRLCASVMFIVAPTTALSSAAGSRCAIFTEVFLMTSGISRPGICSAMTRPSPYARTSASMPANISTA